MKTKIYFLILFFHFLFISLAMGQVTYFHYLDYSSRWYNKDSYFRFNPDGFEVLYFTQYFKGDTLINNNWYYKQYITGIDSFFKSNNDTTISLINGLSGMVREDTLNRVYSLCKGCSTEKLDWDYNIKLNDNINGGTINKIDTIWMDSSPLKRFFINYDSKANIHEMIVEGIGLGFLNNLSCYEVLSGMICYQKGSDFLQISAKCACSFNTSVIDKVNKEIPYFSIYPNPTGDEINITSNHLPGEKIRFRLFNNLGQIVFVKELKNDKSIINLINIPPGIYLVEMFTEKISVTQLFIKH